MLSRAVCVRVQKINFLQLLLYKFTEQKRKRAEYISPFVYSPNTAYLLRTEADRGNSEICPVGIAESSRPAVAYACWPVIGEIISAGGEITRN